MDDLVSALDDFEEDLGSVEKYLCELSEDFTVILNLVMRTRVGLAYEVKKLKEMETDD